MKAAVFRGLEDIRIEDKEIRPLKDNELLIRVMACGICGTDIHIYHGEQGSAPVKSPVVLGHEYSGEVIRLGKQVKDFIVGDRIAVDPNMYCGACAFCRTGKQHLCENLTALGVNLDGGFGEYCIVPSSQAYKFQQHITFEEAAMVEPLACCLHGIDLAGIEAGKKVAIIGGGAIGLIMTQLSRLRGASHVLVSEPLKKRRELALQLGADEAINPLEEEIGESLFDVVIECAGKEMAMNSAFKLVNKGGTVLLFSVPSPEAALTIRPFEVFQKELTIRGSFINPSTHGRAMDLITSGRVRMKPLITHVFHLEEISKALEMQTSPDSVKVIIKP